MLRPYTGFSRRARGLASLWFDKPRRIGVATESGLTTNGSFPLVLSLSKDATRPVGILGLVPG
jgi:hypothetical protein